MSIIAIFEELENWFSCVISALDRLTFNGLGYEKDIGNANKCLSPMHSFHVGTLFIFFYNSVCR